MTRPLVTFSSLGSVVDKLFGAAYIVAMSISGLSAFQISVALAWGSLVVAVSDFPTGAVADRWGRKRTAAVGAAVLALAHGVYAVSHHLVLFLVAMTLWALGTALGSGTASAWAVDELERIGESSLRTRIFSRVSTISLLVGAAAAVGASGLMKVSVPLALFTGAGLAVLLAVLFVRLGRENYGDPSPELGFWKQAFGSLGALVASRDMAASLAKICLRHLALVVFLLAYQLYATRVLGLPVSAMGILLAVSIFAMAAGSYLVGPVSRRLSERSLTIIGTGLSAIGLLVMALSKEPAIWIAGLVVFEIGLGADMVAFSSWIHDFIPSAFRSSFDLGHLQRPNPGWHRRHACRRRAHRRRRIPGALDRRGGGDRDERRTAPVAREPEAGVMSASVAARASFAFQPGSVSRSLTDQVCGGAGRCHRRPPDRPARPRLGRAGHRGRPNRGGH